LVGCAFLRRRRPVPRPLLGVAAGAALLAVLGLYLTWLASPMEVPRHAIPCTVVLPLMLVYGSLLFADAAVAPPARHEDRDAPRAAAPPGGPTAAVNGHR
jgi:hypothetical protein